ncbi:signal peptidase II [Carnobacteriaceae bacterium zg-ZUI252]|nr:signal peptidase II [Carnobacteriaceae bacterium zg-ZUI252]MBS4770278.1 signal peptidase II [Carnobacteriaceae bacterium zg-ZUI240]
MVLIYSSIILLLILDQGVKMWTAMTIPLNTGQAFIPNVLSLFHLRNTGAAWGILSDNLVFFFIVTILICAGMICWAHKQKRRNIEYVAYVLIFAGAVGNFIDRVRLGYVIDMFRFEFIDFPIFNVADICLTLGVTVMIVDALVTEWKERGK